MGRHLTDPLPEFAAIKEALKLGSPEAAPRLRLDSTQTCLSDFSKAALRS